MIEGKRNLHRSVTESPVPEALGRLLVSLAKRVGTETMDRIWIFPPL